MDPILKKALDAYNEGDFGKIDVGGLRKWMQSGRKSEMETLLASSIIDAGEEFLREQRPPYPESPQVFGSPFHNPYTFIPFPVVPPDGSLRRQPTPLTADEDDPNRLTGVLRLKIELRSPLLTKTTEYSENPESEHRTYDALSIGKDIVMPATGVRGSLRGLLSIVAGETLSYVDEEAWMVQGRDVNLGPAPNVPPNGNNIPPLARVKSLGGNGRPGVLEVGETKLVPGSRITALYQKQFGVSLPRPTSDAGRDLQLWVDDILSSISKKKTDNCGWAVKISGDPVGAGRQGKNEGILLTKRELRDVPASLWDAYRCRNRHGKFEKLMEGDLVWLALKDGVNRAGNWKESDIASLQWARLGRSGKRLIELVVRDFPDGVPDATRDDGLVDEVNDLFGLVPRIDLREELKSSAGKCDQALESTVFSPFAARVRPGNLVFRGANREGHLETCTLPVMSSPKPGCVSFYRKPPGKFNPKEISESIDQESAVLRGYKVYRTTNERGDRAPWKANVRQDKSNQNQTVKLLNPKTPEGECTLGDLRISFRSLTKRELALIIAVCTVDWRLGGGKPFGLGHCRVAAFAVDELTDEGELKPLIQEIVRNRAEKLEIPVSWRSEIDPNVQNRLATWQATQNPVEKLRYPRARKNGPEGRREDGTVWFGRHAKPTFSGHGLEKITTANDAVPPLPQRTRIHGQPLPLFSESDTDTDKLFGYDVFVDESDRNYSYKTQGGPRVMKKFDPPRMT